MSMPMMRPKRKNPILRTRVMNLPPAARGRVALGLTSAAAEGRFMLPRNRETGRFADPDKVHHTDFQGKFLRSHGTFTVPRSPQGHPIVVQSGSSVPGQQMAARTADVVFTARARGRTGRRCARAAHR